MNGIDFVQMANLTGCATSGDIGPSFSHHTLLRPGMAVVLGSTKNWKSRVTLNSTSTDFSQTEDPLPAETRSHLVDLYTLDHLFSIANSTGLLD